MSGNECKVSLEEGNFLFRFRSAKALLDDDPENGGFQEIKKQTIYFAQPHTLNDPMEGVSDAFWDGDQVLWENFFRHYALSLVWYSGAWMLSKPEEIEQAKVDAWITEADLPTDSYRDLYREFCSRFCSEINAEKLASLLGCQTVPLRRERLISLLYSIHQVALFHLFPILKQRGLCNIDLPTKERVKNSSETIVNAWEEIVLRRQAGDMTTEDYLELFAGVANRVNHQLELGMLSRSRDKSRTKKLVALLARFPEAYADAFLRDLHFTPWRVACFSHRCVNASMWGTYGDEHRGAALVFRTEKQGSERSFCVQGVSGTGVKGFNLQVRPVTYRNRPPEVDSFLQMGILPMAKLERTWMVSENGVPSIRLQEMTNDMDTWRNNYWEKAYERTTWKHPDWEHEEERRLVVSTVFSGDPAPEPLTYQFSQLEGIVFGMRMSSDDKLRIVEEIEIKCLTENRKDFRFFQAYYSPSKGKMDIAELGLLTFSQKVD